MLYKRGEQKPNAKFTDAEIVEIRRRYRAGEGTYVSLAIKHNVTLSNMGKILTGETWKHLL